MVDGRCQRVEAGRAETLEAGDLRLDGDDGVTDGVDDRAAVGQDTCRGTGRGGTTEHAGRGIVGLGPELARIGIEPEHDLRLALGHDGGESVGYMNGRQR
jgi:hypothetical protein